MAESLGWRWEFGVQVPVLMVCFSISVAAIPTDIGLEDGRKDVWIALRGFDLKGSALLATSTSSLILGLVIDISHPINSIGYRLITNVAELGWECALV